MEESEDIEDFVLGLLMLETDYDDVIDLDEFIKDLKGNSSPDDLESIR